MQFYFHANQSHFHKHGFALRLAFKQGRKGTRKWPVIVPHIERSSGLLSLLIVLCDLGDWREECKRRDVT